MEAARINIRGTCRGSLLSTLKLYSLRIDLKHAIRLDGIVSFFALITKSFSKSLLISCAAANVCMSGLVDNVVLGVFF